MLAEKTYVTAAPLPLFSWLYRITCPEPRESMTVFYYLFPAALTMSIPQRPELSEARVLRAQPFWKPMRHHRDVVLDPGPGPDLIRDVWQAVTICRDGFQEISFQTVESYGFRGRSRSHCRCNRDGW